MKKCRGCQKNATLHVTEIRDGEVQAIHLCEGCAQGYLSPTDEAEADDDLESSASSLSAKLDQLAGEDELDDLDHLVCPNCSITFAEFRSKGRLGCPQDYEVFGEELIPLLENIHSAQQHTGKIPRRAPDGSQRQYQLIKLRNDLRIAVEEEDYETAASLRDEILTLETELNGDSSE